MKLGGHWRVSGSQVTTLLVCLIYLALLAGGLFAAEGELGGWNPNATVGIVGASAGLNFLYIGVIVFGLVASVNPVSAQYFGWILFIVFIGLTAYGAASIITTNEGDMLNVLWPNVVLYGFTSVTGLLLGMGGVRGALLMRGSYSPMGQQDHA